jgi:hypothetical protein
MSRRAKSWFAIIVLGCVACCAIPIMAALGIGSGVGALTAAFNGFDIETVVCLGLAGALVAVGLVLWLRQRKRCVQDPATSDSSCSADGSCCGPQSKGMT